MVTAARPALEGHDVSIALPFVEREGEEEVVRAFEAAEKARRHGAEAREVADLYFFETSGSEQLEVWANNLYQAVLARAHPGHDGHPHG